MVSVKEIKEFKRVTRAIDEIIGMAAEGVNAENELDVVAADLEAQIKEMNSSIRAEFEITPTPEPTPKRKFKKPHRNIHEYRYDQWKKQFR